MHRATFRHVVHCRVLVHVDSASRVKLLTAAYELGFVRNHPTFAEVLAAILNQKTSKLNLHPIANARLLVWGAGRTRGPHLAKNATAKSDTSGRLHSVAWVAVNAWHPETSLVTGGF